MLLSNWAICSREKESWILSPPPEIIWSWKPSKFEGQTWNYPAPRRHLQQTTVRMQIWTTSPHSKPNCNFTQPRFKCFWLQKSDIGGIVLWVEISFGEKREIGGGRNCVPSPRSKLEAPGIVAPSCGLIVQTCGTVAGTNPPPSTFLHPLHPPPG